MTTGILELVQTTVDRGLMTPHNLWIAGLDEMTIQRWKGTSESNGTREDKQEQEREDLAGVPQSFTANTGLPAVLLELAHRTSFKCMQTLIRPKTEREFRERPTHKKKTDPLSDLYLRRNSPIESSHMSAGLCNQSLCLPVTLLLLPEITAKVSSKNNNNTGF